MIGNTTTLDPLTGAYSRATMMPSLSAALEVAQVSASPLSLLIIDLDYFKTINDAFGHLRGDKILEEFVRRLRTIAPGHDLFRYGGDEFVLLLRQTDHETARALAEHLCHAIHAQPFGSDAPLTLSLTIGCASLDGETSTAQSLFERADRRLLAAKRAGRNRVISDDIWELVAPARSAASRLVEREPGYETLHTFLGQLPTEQRGQLTISGARGVGRTAFLAEARHRAHVQGFLVLDVRGQAGIKMREYGALQEAITSWPSLPSPVVSIDHWLRALSTLLVSRRCRGVIFAVDDLDLIDPASRERIRDTLRATHDIVVGVIFTVSSVDAQRARTVMSRYQLDVELAPLSRKGVGIWLRSSLHWEPPFSFTEWLHGETGGLPALLHAGVSELTAQRILTSSADGWVIAPDFAARAIGDRLNANIGSRLHNLPLPDTLLVGRDHELSQVRYALHRGELVSIVGPGGLGKTRLAQQVALETVDQFHDGAWFVSLADLATGEQMVYAIANVLSIPLTGHIAPLQQLVEGLQGRDLLLVVDNVEHIDGGSAILQRIRKHAPTLALLITSREPTGIVGERLIELEGLTVLAPTTEHAVAQSSAIRLFCRLAEQRGYALREEDLEPIGDICRTVGGMPLGIELACAWVELYACHEIADHVAHDDALLSHTPQGAPLDAMRSVFDYFWRQLSADEQRVVRRLGVFRGGFEREAAATIAGASPFLLAALVDKAFLTRTGTGRYTLHKLLQQYAERHLATQPEDLEAVNRAHATYYCVLAERASAELLSSDQTVWLQRLEAEHDNFRRALDWARQTGHVEDGLRLVAHLAHFWRVRGHCTEGRAWIGQFLDASDPSIPGYTQAARWLGVLAQEQGDYATAETVLQAYLSTARAGEDRASVADALGYLGWIASAQGSYAHARHYLEEGMLIARDLDEPGTLLHILNNLGEVTFRQGEIELSRAWYEESRCLAHHMGDRREIGESLLGLGNACFAQGDIQAARAYYAECVEHARAIEDRRRLGESLGNLGMLAHQQKELPDAQRLLREGLANFEAIGDQLGVAMALAALGVVALDLNDVGGAERWLCDGLTLALRIGAQPTVFEALAGLAALAIKRGLREQPLECLAFIAQHPATPTALHGEVARLCATLEAEPSSVPTQHLTLDAIVAQMRALLTLSA